MKNNIKSMVFASILASLIIATPYMVKAETANGGDDSPSQAVVEQAAVVSNQNTSNGGDDVAGNASGGTTNGGDDVSAVSANISNGGDDAAGAQSNNVSGSVTQVPLNGNDDTGGTQAPSNPVIPPANTGGGSPSITPANTSFSGGSSSGGSALISGRLPVLNSIGQCEYITSYMKLGGNNSTSEVNKLQTFLKNNEKINVNVTGIFDDETFEAVKSFQAKYLADTMAPWGVNTPSGQVYFTTKKKINEIYCKSNFTLTAEQTKEIEAYKTSLANNIANTSAEVTESITSTTSIPLTGSSTEVGSVNNESQTASVANTSFFGKAWKFIKGIFGR